MISERRYLLTRCLRLEATIGKLQREMAETRRHQYRHATESDRAFVRDLRRQGLTARAIAARTGWSMSTVYAFSKTGAL